MTETPKKVHLDAALRAWPESNATVNWEEMALAIDERIRTAAPGTTPSDLTNDDFLLMPLGQIEGEGHNSAAPVKAALMSKGETMTMPADRERDRRSLQDLAKMATEGMPAPPSLRAPLDAPSAPPSMRVPESKADDSGIVDLAMAAQSDPQAALRAQTTPLASEGLFDDDSGSKGLPASKPAAAAVSAPASAPPSLLRQPVPTVPPVSSAPSFAPSDARPVPTATDGTKKKGGLALILGGLVAAAAIAAGGFLFVQSQRAKAPDAVGTKEASPPVVATVAPVQPAPTAEPAAPVSESVNAAPDTKTPDTKAHVAPKAVPANGARVAAKEVAEAPKAEEAAKLSTKDLPPSAAGQEGDLGKAMGAAVGADGKPIQPAAGANGPQFAAGSVPQKPSQGAVTGAIGAVLPGARACLGPDDPVSRASITFTSAGSVQSVSVSGGAAGKPAEGCIKAALGRAKVAPFAEPAYTANVTVRH